MKIILFPVYLMLMLFLGGCSFFGWYMNGDTHSNRIFDRDEWTKPNINDPQKKEDWISCGGNSAGIVAFSDKKQGQSLTDYTIQAQRESDAAQACMMKKGYKFIGSCKGELSIRLACKGRSIFNL